MWYSAVLEKNITAHLNIVYMFGGMTLQSLAYFLPYVFCSVRKSPLAFDMYPCLPGQSNTMRTIQISQAKFISTHNKFGPKPHGH